MASRDSDSPPRSSGDERARGNRPATTDREQLRAIAAHYPGILARLDRDLRHRFASNEYAVVYGTPADAIVGRTLAEVIGEEAHRTFAPHIKRALGGERVSFRSTVVIPATGNRRSGLLTMAPEFDADGRVDGLLIVASAIMPRRKVDEALRRSQEYLATIIALEPECVKVVSLEGRLLEMNPAGLAMIEAESIEQVRGSLLSSLIVPEHQRAFAELLERVGSGGEGTLVFESVGQRGTRRWLETHAVPLRQDGQVTGMLGVTRDITERRAAEEALRVQHERLRLIARATNDVVWDWDIAAQTVTWNERYQERFGYAVDADGTGRVAWRTCLHPDDEERVWSSLLAALGQGGEDWSAEYRFRAHDGTYADIHDRGYIVRNAQGVAVRVIGTMQDLTQRLKDAQALRQSEARLLGLLEAAPDGVLVVNAHRVITLINGAAEAMFGYGRGELTGKVVDDLVPEMARGRHAAHVKRFLVKPIARAMGSGIELSARRRDGTEFPVDIMLGPLASGDRTSTLCMVRDISARKRHEAELAAARGRLQLAVAAGNVGLWDWHPDTGAIHLSEECKRQLGYSTDEIVGTVEEWRARVHPDDLAEVWSVIDSLAQGERSDFELEYRLLHKNGGYRTTLARGAVRRDGQGRPVQVFGSHVDITDRLAMHSQLQEAQRMDTVGRLAGGMAHDFNNELTVIGVAADLAMSQLATDSPLRVELREIQQASSRAAGLTRQLLAFSRKQIMRPEILDVNDLIATTRPLLEDILGEDVRLEVSQSERLRNVRADPGQLQMVLVNLADNACDAMPGGGRLILTTNDVDLGPAEASRLGVQGPGPYVVITLSDTGHGIAADVRSRIFEPFFSTKDATTNRGLGLATAYGIVKQSGGTMTVGSEAGHGATFCVFLPSAEGAEGAAERPQPRHEAGAGGAETILVVEDEPALRRLAERALASAGYEVLVAGDGEEALRVLQRHGGHVALLFTDLVMPGMNGWQLADRVRRNRPAMRVLFSSGYTADAQLRGAMHGQAGQFLGKPYAVRELLQRVREVIDA